MIQLCDENMIDTWVSLNYMKNLTGSLWFLGLIFNQTKNKKWCGQLI
jgi:hypothetical protein